jgi:AmmeMemoRadiSam system protein A
MLPCRKAIRLPTVIVSAANTANIPGHTSIAGAKAVTKTRISTAKPAAFEPTERKVVTGVGAPSYTSGAHIWNGTEDILKPNPAATKTIAASKAGLLPVSANLAPISDSTVVISPHGPVRRQVMGIGIAPVAEGNLAMFNAPQVTMQFTNDSVLVEAIEEAAQSREIPLARFAARSGVYELDHGVVVPMYFLRQALNSDVALVPLTYSLLPYERHLALGQAIRDGAEKAGRRVAVIASGDLSHRLTRDAPAGYDPLGKVLDEAIVDAVSRGDAQALMGIEEETVERGGECGLRSIIILMGALQGSPYRPEVLSYEGPFGVGYMVAAMHVDQRPEIEEGTSLNMSAKQNEDGGCQPAVGDNSDSDIVQLARQAVEAHVLEGRHTELPTPLPPALASKAGVFVCIKKGGNLRGCIGTFEPTYENIAEEIVHNAVSSATQDPRFPRVSPDELANLSYSVDILTSPEQVNGPAELDPQRYGVIVESGYRRGLLLPDLEGVDTAEEQIEIARQKAGIGSGEALKLYRFEVKRYGELEG